MHPAVGGGPSVKPEGPFASAFLTQDRRMMADRRHDGELPRISPTSSDRRRDAGNGSPTLAAALFATFQGLRLTPDC